MNYELSAPNQEELALVYDAWIQSFRKSPWAGCVRNDLYATVQRATISEILARGAVVTVALAPVVEGVHEGRRVMGYAVTEPALEVLHWWYVKDPYRKHGVGRALLNAVTSGWHRPRYTHRTRFSSLLPKRFRWDPVPARVNKSAS